MHALAITIGCYHHFPLWLLAASFLASIAAMVVPIRIRQVRDRRFRRRLHARGTAVTIRVDANGQYVISEKDEA